MSINTVTVLREKCKLHVYKTFTYFWQVFPTFHKISPFLQFCLYCYIYTVYIVWYRYTEVYIQNAIYTRVYIQNWRQSTSAKVIYTAFILFVYYTRSYIDLISVYQCGGAIIYNFIPFEHKNCNILVWILPLTTFIFCDILILVVSLINIWYKTGVQHLWHIPSTNRIFLICDFQKKALWKLNPIFPQNMNNSMIITTVPTSILLTGN